jgi:hypothetical protein
MFEVARTVHDALDLLAPPSECSAVADLIAAFFTKIDFGRDLERQLEVLTDCRQAFTNVDALKGAIVRAEVELANKALRLVKGRHTPKTSQFVRAIFASVATSIASLDDPFARMALAMFAAGAALPNGCVAQADLLYRAAIQEIPELPAAAAIASALSGTDVATGSREAAVVLPIGSAAPSSSSEPSSAVDFRLVLLLADLGRAIVIMPGHPEHGPFYLARGLLNAIQKFPWTKGAASVPRCRATVALLPTLVDFGRDPLPGRIPTVESNDVLFAGEPSYREELRQLVRAVLEVVVAQLQEAKGAADADPGSSARAVLTEAIPELLRPALLRDLLEGDPGVLPAVEAATLLLKGVAPDHPVVKNTVAFVQERMRAKAAARA